MVRTEAGLHSEGRKAGCGGQTRGMQKVKVRLELTDGYEKRFTEAVCRRVAASKKQGRAQADKDRTGTAVQKTG